MNSNNDDKRRRSNRSPFDREHEFNQFIRIIEQMMEKALEESARGNLEPGKSYVRGFNFHVDSNGKPRIEEFGNYPLNASEGKIGMSEEREPLVDVFENDKNVAITIEIPGVDLNDIDLKAWDKKLEINVNHLKRKYHRLIDLPCDVKPKTTKATYKNGILDVTMQKTEKNNTGHRVNID